MSYDNPNASDPRSRLLATCSADTTIKIWTIGEDWKVRKKTELVGHQRWVWDAAFSADSAYLVSGEYTIPSPLQVLIWRSFFRPRCPLMGLGDI